MNRSVYLSILYIFRLNVLLSWKDNYWDTQFSCKNLKQKFTIRSKQTYIRCNMQHLEFDFIAEFQKY